MARACPNFKGQKIPKIILCGTMSGNTKNSPKADGLTELKKTYEIWE